jgi:UDP-2-acetamido-2,6-beta-L-arabino-hexul-4-ose reductase
MNEKLEIKKDERGSLIEVFKFLGVGQVFYSTTNPGFTRGNHYHTRKIERFCVIEGEGLIRLRNRETNEIKEYKVSGKNPETVEMTIGWTHNIKNVGEGEMKLIVWANEVFDPNDPDTFAEIV